MENFPVDALLASLVAEEDKHIDELVQIKETESRAIAERHSMETVLGQAANKVKEVVFEQYFKKRRSPILARFLGQKALRVHYGHEQLAREMGFSDNRRILNVPYVETLPLMTNELMPFEGFEGYRFSQGWIFRIQVGRGAKLKKLPPPRYLKSKIEPYALDTPLGIHLAVTEHITGNSTNELRYRVSDKGDLTVFHSGKREPLLGQASNIQLEVLGLMNKAVDELTA